MAGASLTEPQPQFYLIPEIHRDLTCLPKTSESFSKVNETKQKSNKQSKGKIRAQIEAPSLDGLVSGAEPSVLLLHPDASGPLWHS